MEDSSLDQFETCHKSDPKVIGFPLRKRLNGGREDVVYTNQATGLTTMSCVDRSLDERVTSQEDFKPSVMAW